MKILLDHQRRSYLWVKSDKNNEIIIPLDSAGLAVVKLNSNVFDREYGMKEYKGNILNALKIFERSITNFGATSEASKLIKEALNEYHQAQQKS